MTGRRRERMPTLPGGKGLGRDGGCCLNRSLLFIYSAFFASFSASLSLLLCEISL